MRARRTRWGMVFAMVAAVAVLAGCGGGGGGGGGSAGGLVAGGNVLNPGAVEVGDLIGEMNVEEVGPVRPGVNVEPNFRVSFMGQVTVTGEYHYHAAGRTPGQVWFGNLDEESLARVPRVAGDHEYDGFFFDNLDFAKEKFGPAGSKGTATIVIDQYVVERYPGHTKSDKADLIDVISIEPKS